MKTETSRYVNVTAQAVKRGTLIPIGQARTEKIDLLTNEIFKGCRDGIDVAGAFENFWNINPNSKEIVLVKNIEFIN